MKRVENQSSKQPAGPAPEVEPASETRQKLREIDTLNVDFGDEFYQKMHDRIMARIEHTPVKAPLPSEPKRRRQAKSSELSLVP